MKKVTDKHRFYVVMPKTLTLPTKAKPTLPLPCGMAAAQAAHAIQGLVLRHVKDHKNGFEQMNQPITKIVKKCRDERELHHVEALADFKKIPYFRFFDTNDQLYGGDYKVITATAFGPITAEEAKLVLDYLPLWNCED